MINFLISPPTRTQPFHFHQDISPCSTRQLISLPKPIAFWNCLWRPGRHHPRLFALDCVFCSMGQTSGQVNRFAKSFWSRYQVNPHQMIGSVDEEIHTNCHICHFASTYGKKWPLCVCGWKGWQAELKNWANTNHGLACDRQHTLKEVTRHIKLGTFFSVFATTYSHARTYPSLLDRWT